MSQLNHADAQSNALVSLSSSVSSLRASLSLLESSISVLADGTADFSRLKTVLASKRHFELVPSSALVAAQKSLAAEIEPIIATLLSRAESYIAKLERKQQGLVARSQLLSGRLDGAQVSSSYKMQENYKKKENKLVKPCGISSSNEQKATRLKILRQEKERLGYTIERLVLQSQQRQRQVRKSIAAT
ncbi:hypothetical protein EPUL_002324 [Erysiphe pulchra]|uniref:DASH complex subunit SPC19 n=1 Tax=Erysiphe pulchra TaxID=225359 RepID=A0A2S4PZQ1_9PEZI|nr:hypothetical protein EPUL_002324 [Erysiphe pulchra]